MAGDKTEQPTQKRIRESRQKGQIFKSKDLIQAMLFATAAAILTTGGGRYITELKDLMKESFQPDVMRGDMPLDAIVSRMGYAWAKFLLLSTPLLGALMVTGVAANFVQVKALFAPEVVKPKFEKLNPLAGLKNIFASPKTYIEVVKNLLKFATVFWILYATIRRGLRDVIPTAG